MFTKIREKLSWRGIEKDFTEIVKRFPFSVIALFVLFGLATILLHTGLNHSDIEYPILIKSIMTAVFVALLAYTIAMGRESWNFTKNKIVISSYIFIAVLGMLYYLYIPSNLDHVASEVMFTLFGIQILVLLGSFCSRFEKQFLTKTYEDTPFYLFVLRQVSAVIEGFAVALFVFLLGAATLGSLDALFSLSVDGDWYAQLWIFSATLVGPLYFLSHIPKVVNEDKLQLGSLGTFLRFVVLYVALPFIGIYLLILYAYTIKVLLNFSQWPEGVISWMVILFSFFGFIIYFLSFNVRTEKVVALFRKWFPYVLAPQLAMLFYAIGLRIAQHGITINRYLVVAFGLWIGFLCLYYIFSQKKSLFAMPFSLLIALVLVLIGPWGVFATSERSQVAKVDTLFEKYNISQNGSAIVLSKEQAEAIPQVDRDSIISTIRYVCENHGCDSLNKIYGNSYDQALQGVKDGDVISSYNQTNNLLTYIGLPTYVDVSLAWRENKYVSVFGSYSGLEIMTDSYQRFALVDSYQNNLTGVRVSVVGENVSIIIPSDIGVISVDITEDLHKYFIENNSSFRRFDESESLPVFLFGNQEISGKLYITNGSASRDGDTISDISVSGYLFYWLDS